MRAGRCSHAREALHELKTILLMAAPMTIAIMGFVAMEFVSVAILGHYGTRYLSAASLAQTWTESTRVFLTSGAVGTLCSQAYGAGQLHLVGVWFQIALVMGVLISVPVAIGNFMTATVLGPFGYEEEQLELAQRFAVLITIGILPQMAFERLFRYLQSIAVFAPTMITMILTVCIYAALATPMVYGIFGWEGLGFDGAPLAVSIATWGELLLLWLIACCIGKKHKATWPGWQCLREVTCARTWIYLKLYIPNVLQAGSELWRFQLLSAFAGLLGEVELSAHMIGFRVIYIGYICVFSLSMAGTQRVGSALGGNRPDAARMSCYVGAAFATCCALALGVVISTWREGFARLFTHDPELIEVCKLLAPKIAIAQFFMTLADYFNPMLNTQGRPNAALVSSFLSSWLGHVPVCYVLVFHVYRHESPADRISALWVGVCVGYVAQCGIACACVLCSDWPALALLARRNNEVREAGTTADTDLGTSLQPAAHPESSPEDAAAA